MQRAQAVLNDELERHWGVRLTVRTGVNTGQVVAGDPTAGQRLVTGDAVNVAARLEQAAGAQEVLLGDLTYRLVRDYVDVEEVEPLELKGKAERVPAYRLVGVREDAERPRAPRRADGRARRRSSSSSAPRFARSIDERPLPARHGRSARRASGSRASSTSSSRSVEGEASVLRGRCLPYGDGITFWPLAEAVRARGADRRTRHDRGRRCEKLAALVGRRRRRRARRVGDRPLADAVPRAGARLGRAQAAREPRARRARCVVALRRHPLGRADVPRADRARRRTRARRRRCSSCCTARHELVERLPGLVDRRAAPQRIQLARADRRTQTAAVAEHLLGDGRARRGDPRRGSSQPPKATRSSSSSCCRCSSTKGSSASRTAPGARRRDDRRRRRPADDPRAPRRPARPPRAPTSARSSSRPPSSARCSSATPCATSRPSTCARARLASRDAHGQAARPARSHATPRRTHSASTTSSSATRRTTASSSARGPTSTSGSSSGPTASIARVRPSTRRSSATTSSRRIATSRSSARSTTTAARSAPTASRRLAAAGRRAFARGDVPAAANLLGRAVDLLPDDDAAQARAPPRVRRGAPPGRPLRGGRATSSTMRSQRSAPARRCHAWRARVASSGCSSSSAQASQEGWRDEAADDDRRGDGGLRGGRRPRGAGEGWRLLAWTHGTACHFGLAAEAQEHALEEARLAGDVRQQRRAATAYAVAAVFGPTPVAGGDRALRGDARAGLRAIATRRACCSPTSRACKAMSGSFDEARELHATRPRDARGARPRRRGRPRRHRSVADRDARSRPRGRGARAPPGLRFARPPSARSSSSRRPRASSGRRSTRSTAWTRPSSSGSRRRRSRRRTTSTRRRSGAASWGRSRARRGDVDKGEALVREALDILEPTDAVLLKFGALLDLAEVLRLGRREPEAKAAIDEATSSGRAEGQRGHVARRHATLAALDRSTLVS